MRNSTQISPYSGEEEAILKNVIELAGKKVQEDCDLSSILEKYNDFLLRIDISEACSYLVLNFAKAAVFLEKSTLLYCIKIDRLSVLAECLIDALKESAQRKKQRAVDDGDDNIFEEEQEQSPQRARRRGKRVRGDLAEEDFFEIDNHKGLGAKDMSERAESEETSEAGLFLDQALTLFNKTKRLRKRIVVYAAKSDDKEECRLRDWVLTESMMIVREMCTTAALSDESRFNGSFGDTDTESRENSQAQGGDWLAPVSPQSVMSDGSLHNNNSNNDDHMEGLSRRASSASSFEFLAGGLEFTGKLGGVIVDTKEGFGIQEDVPSKKMKPGVVTRSGCDLCDTRKVHTTIIKSHRKKSKKCLVGRTLGTLDSFFFPFVQPTLGDIQFGVLPDEELFTLYKAEMKVLLRLEEQPKNVNLNALKKQQEKGDKFDGFGLDEDDRDADDDDGGERGLESVHDFDLPLPSITLPPLPPCDDPEPSHSDFANIIEEIREDAAQQCMERNKLLGIRTAEWHASLVDKIALSQRRGALDMDSLAGTIMSTFPTSKEDASSEPNLSFRDLVSGQNQRDIPRFFLACLQLTNEGNISIEKACSNPINPDCIQLSRLRSTRVRMEFEEQPSDAPVPSTSGGRSKGSSCNKRQRPVITDSEDESVGNVPKSKKKAKKGKGIRI